VYVCTAAERQYALEVWRLLDPNASLIPMPLRRQRLVNVAGGRLKTLPNALGLLPHGEEAGAALGAPADQEQAQQQQQQQQEAAAAAARDGGLHCKHTAFWNFDASKPVC